MTPDTLVSSVTPQNIVMITNHDRLLAREVITAACARYASGLGPDCLIKHREAVMAERWPARGTGGVAMAQRKTVAAVRRAITEFYEPSPTEY